MASNPAGDGVLLGHSLVCAMRRTPLRRYIGQPDKAKRKPTAASIRKASSQAIKKECARLCRDIVFRRAGHKCERSGATSGLQWAHIYPRRYRHLIYDPDNGMCLSVMQHLFWWHRNPIEAAEWIASLRGAAFMERLRVKALAGSGKPDMEATLLYLRSLA